MAHLKSSGTRLTLSGRRCMQATVVSPWIVTAEALRQFVTAPPDQVPPPQQYLREKTRASFDITMFSSLTPAGCSQAQPVAMSMFKDVYWTFEQMIAHHTVGGCNLRPGDLLGSGTVSSAVRAWLLYDGLCY